MITFDPESHTYTNDGVVLPSVTQIVTAVFGKTFENVPRSVLKEKAEYGQRIHTWIEEYALTGKRKRQSELMKISTDQVKDIFFEERILIRKVEQMVHTDRYAGKYDMYGTHRGKTCLIDIKSTAVLDVEYLALQLGMYKNAMAEDVEECACLWVPKGKTAKFVPIEPKDNEFIEWALWRYENEFDSGRY